MESKCPKHDLCAGCRCREKMQLKYRMDKEEPYVCPVNGIRCWICECEYVTDDANEEFSWVYWNSFSLIGFILDRYVDLIEQKLDNSYDRGQTIPERTGKLNFPTLRKVAAPIGVLLLTMYIPGVLSEGVNVEWKLKKEPVIFGKDLHLQCQIDDKKNDCQKNHRQWLGGKDYDLLCKDGVCLNERKCTETVDEMCMYTLVVYNVTEDDINCPYTCSYGVYHQRKYLMLDEDIFIYDPTSKKEMIKKNISVENGDLSIFIQIEKVYPAPECVILFEHENISKAEDMNTTMRSDGFFTTEVKVAIRLSTCKGVLEMKCRIGKENREIVDVFVYYCKVDEKTIDLLVWIGVVFVCIGAALGLTGMCQMLLKDYKRSSNTETDQERPQEMAPMMKC